MKKLVLLLVLLLAGCATQPKYQWTSDTGKKCYDTCKSGRETCNLDCLNAFCLSACEKAQYDCMKVCPDVVEEKQ